MHVYHWLDPYHACISMEKFMYHNINEGETPLKFQVYYCIGQTYVLKTLSSYYRYVSF